MFYGWLGSAPCEISQWGAELHAHRHEDGGPAAVMAVFNALEEQIHHLRADLLQIDMERGERHVQEGGGAQISKRYANCKNALAK